MINVAINGFGRIGRNTLRAIYERPEINKKLRIVAINDLGDSKINAHLTAYDSVHGKFQHEVIASDDMINIDGQSIRVFKEPDPSQLPWTELSVDLVFECTGRYTNRSDAQKHLDAGAGKVLVSAPGTGMDSTIVFGVNNHVLSQEHRIVSNASCTTNCLAPLAKCLDDAFGIKSGLMTTIHSYTNDQSLNDVYHPDIYRARSATLSLIPTKTGAAATIGEVLPQLDGKLDGLALRVPTPNVSLVDLSITVGQLVSADEVNTVIKNASDGALSNILSYNEKPLVSVDFNHNAFSCNFDASLTRVNNDLIKVFAWYDNEWGFSNRMIDVCLLMT